MDAYKYAAKHKLRFSYKGSLNVEDLFHLSLEELDAIYNSLMVKANKDKFTLLEPADEDVTLQMSLDIIKDIVADKKYEAEERKAEALKAMRKKQVLEALANRQNADLSAKSEDELRKMLDEL